MRYRSPAGASRSRGGRPSSPSSGERYHLPCRKRGAQVLRAAQQPGSPRALREREWVQLAARWAPACRDRTSSSRGRPRCPIDTREVRVTMARRPAAGRIQRQQMERELDLGRWRVWRRAADSGRSRLGRRERRPGDPCAECGCGRREEYSAARITRSAAGLRVMGVMRWVTGRPRQGLRQVGRPAGVRAGHRIMAMSRRRVMRHARVHGGRERHLQHGEHQEQSSQPAVRHLAYPTARSRESHAPQGERRLRCGLRRSSPRRCR
jgi:hypothetical protein